MIASIARTRPLLRDPGSVAFANHDWDLGAGLYRRDLRGPNEQGHAWKLEITSSHPGEHIVLETSTDAQLPEGLMLRLIDLEQTVQIDLQGIVAAMQRYRLLSHGPDRPYRLLVLAGTPQFVEAEGASLVAVPSVVTLDQNAPNPFNPATRIRFGLPEAQAVTLEIFDVRGASVATLLHGQLLPAGYHAVIWDGRMQSGRKLASGLYICRLRAGATTRARKILLTK